LLGAWRVRVIEQSERTIVTAALALGGERRVVRHGEGSDRWREVRR
jgi:hypothetical protein